MSVPPQGRTVSTATFGSAFHLGRLCRQIRHEALPHVFAHTVLTIGWDTLHRRVYPDLPDLAAHAVTAVRIVDFPVYGDAEIRRQRPDAFHPWSLTAFFPALERLRVVLRAEECISRGMAARRSWYWGHDEGFTAEDVMKVSGVHWIRRNTGLKKLTFRACALCYDCDELTDARRVLEEVGRRIKKEIEQL